MLTLTHVQKNYQRFSLDCSLEVKEGCITGLIGQNGAGKSTTFKAILNLIQIDNGTIKLFGKNVDQLDMSDKERIGVVLSDSGFSGYLSIKDIIPILECLYHNFDKTSFINRCQQFGLPKDKKIKEFSTGMKAKLKVIVAMSHQAQFLILDEPTSGLDVLARDELLDLMRKYMEEDETRSILISSHISSDLEGLCDDIYMIHDGHIVLHEETDVLLDCYAILKVNEEMLSRIDKRYLLKVKKESFGYSCLTNQKQYYLDNYPDIVVEKGNIDDVIMLMVRGEHV